MFPDETLCNTPPFDCFASADVRPAPVVAPSRPAVKPTPKPRVTIRPTPQPLAIDAAQLPEGDRALMVRFLNVMFGQLDRRIVDHIFTASLVDAAAMYFLTEGLPAPGSIHFREKKFRIPFQESGLDIPAAKLPDILFRAVYTQHFHGVIHFGPATAFGLKATSDGEIMLYDIVDVGLEAFRGGQRNIRELRFSVSDTDLCAQATLDPPFDRSKPGSGQKFCMPIELSDTNRTAINQLATNLGNHLGPLSPVRWMLKILGNE